MKLYLAGTFASNIIKGSNLYRRCTPAEQAGRDSVKHVLESYHYVHKQKFVDKIRNDGCKIFLDSGAFSAFTKGVEIDITGYCDYIKKNADIIEIASVMDGIGDPQKTYDNQMEMERQGTRPLPCFHYGEDERYLEWYIENYDHITLGGMVPISNKQLYFWLDRIWDKYLTDSSGKAKLKVHGFGLTVRPLMERYPWYSVDSSSWVQAAAMGNVMIPGKGIIPISSSSPARRKLGQHIDTYTPPLRDACIAEIRKRGYDFERMQDNYLGRWTFNCQTFTELGDIVTEGNKKMTFHTPRIELF